MHMCVQGVGNTRGGFQKINLVLFTNVSLSIVQVRYSTLKEDILVLTSAMPNKSKKDGEENAFRCGVMQPFISVLTVLNRVL